MAVAGLYWHNSTQPAAMTPPPRWTQPEIDHLDKLAGNVPFPSLVRSMKCKATREGWPPRTAKAIAVKIQRSGQRCRARVGDWNTTGPSVRFQVAPNEKQPPLPPCG